MIEILPIQKKIKAKIYLPGSKSLSNRAVLLGALAKKNTTLKNFLLSDDTVVMINALKKLGIRIEQKTQQIKINGTSGKVKKGFHELYLGNAGTAMRFLTAALCAASFHGKLNGNQRMQQRPIQDLIDALKQLGSNVTSVHQNGCPPIEINSDGLTGGKAFIKGQNSSQYLSALLIAAPLAKEKTEINVVGTLTSKPYVAMTIDLMKKFGVKVKKQNYKKFQIKSSKYKSLNLEIEGDASSAVYFWALAAITGSNITTTNIPSNSIQADMQFLDVLKKMGCVIKKKKNNITVIGPKKLHSLGRINLNDMPDAAMCVAVICALTKGKNKLYGLENLAIKETNRLKALENELNKIGAKTKAGQDYLEIIGNPKNLHGSEIYTYDDHRMAMCFSILGTVIPNIKIKNPECVSKTYPNFYDDLSKAGINYGKNIIIGGMRGAGKTTVGKALAKKLNWQFIDTDKEIELHQKTTISEIVETHDWKYFRKLEKEMIKRLKLTSNTVISTGGGMLIDKVNSAQLKEIGPIVILDCKPETCIARINSSFKRPALSDNTDMVKELEDLYKKRKPIYKKVADIIINNEEQSAEQTADEIIKKVADTKAV